MCLLPRSRSKQYKGKGPLYALLHPRHPLSPSTASIYTHWGVQAPSKKEAMRTRWGSGTGLWREGWYQGAGGNGASKRNKCLSSRTHTRLHQRAAARD